MISIPMCTVSGMNARENWRKRAKRVKAERELVGWYLGMGELIGKLEKRLPCVVTLTRVGPTNGLDSDNLVSSMKAPRDQIAEWLGVDDRKDDLVRYVCRQQRGPEWLVQIEINDMETA